MNDFIEKLIALRNGAGRVAKGTLENISGVGERYDDMREFEQNRNNDIINEKFGGIQEYQNFLNESPQLPETPPQKLGDFIRRIMQLRGGQ